MEVQKCKYHKNSDSIRNCSVCGDPLCEQCIQLDGSKVVCKNCLNGNSKKQDEFDYSSIDLDINDYVGNIDMSDVEDIDVDIDDILKEVEEATKEAREQNRQAREQTKEIRRQTKEQTKEIKRQTKEQTKEIKRQVKEDVKKQTNEIKKQVNDSINKSMKNYKINDENLGYNKYYTNQNNVKKNYSDTLAVLLSLIPGASQMYLGLMNRGLLICFLFCVSLFLLHIPLVYVPIWIASIFDSRKIRKQMDQGEKVKDDTSDIVNIISNPYVILVVAIMLVLKLIGAVISIVSGTGGSWALETILVLGVIFCISEYRKKKRGK